MLPSNSGVIDENINIHNAPSKTFYIDFVNQKVVGMVDGLEAVKQAVFLILNTERYENMVYDWNYGFETRDLVGMPMGYVYPELEQRIEEALMQDDRIQSVSAFSFEKKKNVVEVTFTVTTTFGDFDMETEVVI